MPNPVFDFSLEWKRAAEPPQPHPAFTAWTPNVTAAGFDITALQQPDWLNRLPAAAADHQGSSSSSHVVVPHFIVASRGATAYKPAPVRKVSIATHCSVDMLHRIAAMAEASDMVMSVSVLVQKSVGLSIALIKRLRECSADFERLVDITLVLMTRAGEYDDVKGNASFADIVQQSSGAFTKRSCAKVFRRGFAMLVPHSAHATSYPAALMQRVAQQSVLAAYTLPLELSMVPSVALGAVVETALSIAPSQQSTSQAQAAFVVSGRLRLVSLYDELMWCRVRAEHVIACAADSGRPEAAVRGWQRTGA